MTGNMLLLKNRSVLFAEDDKIVRNQMAEILDMLFLKVFVAKDGEEAYRMYEDEKPDIVISDIQMPKKDGIKLVKQIRKIDYKTPIILLTSFSEQEYILGAANLSVDGYLIKPVELGTIVDTVCRAIQRTPRDMGLIELGGGTIYNPATREMYQNGTLIPLGLKEQELLMLLLKNQSKTLTKDEIIREVWPLDPICDSAIKNLILRLRKKLGFDIIVSVRGIGYRLNIGGNSVRGAS
jgi:two-component system, OmpR family, response regulator VanR